MRERAPLTFRFGWSRRRRPSRWRGSAWASCSCGGSWTSAWARLPHQVGAGLAVRRWRGEPDQGVPGLGARPVRLAVQPDGGTGLGELGVHGRPGRSGHRPDDRPGLPVSAICGCLLLALIYLTSLPLTANAVIDDHIVEILMLIGLILLRNGRVWGAEDSWDRAVVDTLPLLR